MTTNLADGNLFDALRANDGHHFWSDDLPYSREQLDGVIGHLQATAGGHTRRHVE